MQFIWSHTIPVISECQAYVLIYHCLVNPYLFSIHIRIVCII